MSMSAEHAPTQVDARSSTTARMQIGEPWRSVSRAGWLIVFLLTVGLFFLVGVPLSYQIALQDAQQYAEAGAALGLSAQFHAIYTVGLDVVGTLVFAAVALLIFWRKPDRLGLFVSLMLVLFGIGLRSPTFYQIAAVEPALGWPVGIIQGLGNGLFVIFLYVFPDGRFVPRWTRLLAVVWTAWSVLALLPGSVFNFTWLGSNLWGFLAALIGYLSGVYAQTYRHKYHATPTQEQQTKWVLIGLTLALLGYIGTFLPPTLFPALSGATGGALLYKMASQLLFGTLAQIMIPITIGLSILRYRLWEVDIVLNRTMVYGVLTVLLALAFLVSMIVFQQVMMAITGGEQMPVVLAVSALVAGLLFQPTRRRLQKFVDRHLTGFNLLPVPSTKPVIEVEPRFPGALTGAQIGPYEVLEPLGRGGMAEVYKGRHTTLGRPVAIKILAADRAAEEDFRKRFEREAQTVATLKHPNIVEVFDFGVYEGMYYMVMEYIAGHDLMHHIRDSGPMALPEVRAIAAGIASALDYAHAQGIIHRDVKPSNVMLQPNTHPAGPELRPVLTDFGIAKIHSRQTGLTKTGTIGTLDYMAPEQIVSSREVDGRADVYALGVMLYQMLTGELPFAGDNPGAVILGHLQRPAPDPRTLQPDLPTPVAAALQRALVKDPDGRFQTAGALVQALG